MNDNEPQPVAQVRQAHRRQPVIYCEFAQHEFPFGAIIEKRIDARLAYSVVVDQARVVDGDDDNPIEVWDAFGTVTGYAGRASLRGAIGIAVWMEDEQRYELLAVEPTVYTGRPANWDAYWPDETTGYLISAAGAGNFSPVLFWANAQGWWQSLDEAIYVADWQYGVSAPVIGPSTRDDHAH